MRLAALTVLLVLLVAAPAGAAINVDTQRRSSLVSNSVSVGSLQVQNAARVSTPWTTGADTANVWVSASGSYGGCARSAIPVAYSASTDCSPDGANDLCQGGDTGRIKGGSYGNVTITKAGAQSGRSSRCTMTVASGEQATIGNLNLGTYNGGDTGPDWLTIKGNAPCDSSATGNASCSIVVSSYDADFTNQITLDGVEVYYANDTDTSGQIAHTEDSTNFTFINGSIHDANGGGGMIFLAGAGPFTFEKSKIYDALYSQACLDAPDPCHSECFYINQADNVILRSIHMWSCVTQGIFVTCSGGSGCSTPNGVTVDGWIIENSILQRTNPPVSHADSALWLTNTSLKATNWVIRNNIIIGATFDPGTASTGNVAYNNLFVGGTPCGADGFTYSYNVSPTGTGTPTAGSNCGGTGAASFSPASINAGMVAPSWTQTGGDTTSGTRGDFTPNSSTVLDDIANPTSYPATDIRGFPRYFSFAPDVGPYEYGAS